MSKIRTAFGQGVQSKAARIDTMLIESKRALTVDEIATAIKHNRSAVASHINTLRRMSLIASESVENSRCKAYSLTTHAKSVVAKHNKAQASETSETSK